jgi:L-Ala-D/L-Glu epimerase
MRITGAELLFLKIPFKMSISHAAKAGRSSSDSLVLRVDAVTASGYGEAVIRDYVTGSLGCAGEAEGEAVRQVNRLLRPLAGRETSWGEASEMLSGAACTAGELPLLCAAETAIMDLECRLAGLDIYELLDAAPLRSEVAYGGAIPMVPPEGVARFIASYVGFGFPNLKVKVGADPAFNIRVLEACRGAAGPGFDIRVDANSSWDPRACEAQLEICRRFGVSLVEAPFPDSPAADDAMREARTRGFRFMADEGLCTADDVRRVASSRAFDVLNLRLSKNGGLRRTLWLAREASREGLAYQLGCMVGETGILSALGRAAGALLPDPLYVEGSYDDVLLSENVTTESFGFGRGGRAPVLRARGIGYAVDSERLSRLSVCRARCL